MGSLLDRLKEMGKTPPPVNGGASPTTPAAAPEAAPQPAPEPVPEEPKDAGHPTERAPWANPDCRACGGIGFNSQGKPCRACEVASKIKAEAEFEVWAEGKFAYFKERGFQNAIVQCVELKEPPAAPQPTPSPAAPTPPASPKATKKMVNEKAAPTPTPPPQPSEEEDDYEPPPPNLPLSDTLVTDMPEVHAGIATGGKPGRKAQRFTLYINCQPTIGKAKVVRLDREFLSWANDKLFPVKAPGRTYYQLAFFDRQKLVEPAIGDFIAHLGTNHVVAILSDQDSRYIVGMLRPYATCIVEAFAV